MRHLIFSLSLLLMLSVQGQAQVYTVINESFENWPATGWSTYTLGAGNGWVQSWQGPSAAHTGTKAAYSSINNSPVNNWLVTPPVRVVNSNYEFSFWEMFDDLAYYGASTVYISTGSPNPGDGDFQPLFSRTDTSLTYVQKTFSLAAYVGDTVHFAFRYQGTWHVWFVDDVTIGPGSYSDAGLNILANPTGVSTSTGTENVIVQIENYGTNLLDTATISWVVNGVPQTPFLSNNLNLQAGDTLNLTLGAYSFNTPGNYDIRAVVSTPNDANAFNDTLNGNYQISSLKDGLMVGIEPESYYAHTGLQDVRVIVENAGGNRIDSANIIWRVNGVFQPTFSATNLSLDPGQKTEVTIGQYNFSRGVYSIYARLFAVGDTNANNNDYQAYAAVDTFWESFEGRVFPPKKWSMNFGNRDDLNFDTPPHANYYYSSQPDSNFFGKVTDTIFTPLLDISQGDSLRFWIKTSAFLAVNHSVVYQDDSSGQITFLQTLTPTPDSWQHVSVDLSPAAGIHRIGIVSNSNNPGLSKFDLFTSDAPVHINTFDLGFKESDIYFLARKGIIEDFVCVVRNEGGTRVSGGSYSVKLMESPGVQLASLAGVTLEAGEQARFTFNHAFGTLGERSLYFEIDYSLDQNPRDNRSRKTDVYVVPAPTILNPVGRPDFPDANIPFNGNGNTNSLGEDDLSQTIYLNSEVPVPGNIYGFFYLYDNILVKESPQQIPLKVWISQTQAQDLAGGWIPENQLTLVFDDTVEVFSGQSREMYIPFNTPIAYSGLDNLAIQAYAYNPGWPPSILRFHVSRRPFPGPVRSIGVFDYYQLDPSTPPALYNSFTDFPYTTLVIEPVVDTGLVHGTVYDTSNVPLSGARVQLNGTSIQVQTDVNGNYSLPYLPHNTYSLTASLLGYNSETVTVQLDTSDLTLDFYLSDRAQVFLYGNVTGDNAPSDPLINAKIIARGYTLDSALTDPLGNFSLANIYGISDYEVTISMYGYFDTTLVVPVTNSNINLGNILLRQEYISPFDVYAELSGGLTDIYWKDPLDSRKVKVQNDFGDCTFSYTNSPMENVWLGNFFQFSDTTTLTSVEIHTDVYELATDYLTIDILDHNEEVVASSEPFLIYKDTTLVIDIPNIVVYGDIYAMVHWKDNVASTHALCVDFSDPSIPNTATIKYPGQPAIRFTDFLGGGAPGMAFLVRVNTLDDGNNFTNNEELKYNVYKGPASEFPNTSTWQKINFTPFPGTSTLDASWTSSDTTGDYRYAVETIYTNGNSEFTFSNPITWTQITGIFDAPDMAGDLTLSPVPAKEFIDIRFETEKEGDITLAIHNVHGQLLLAQELGKRKSFAIRQEVGHLPEGIYLVSIKMEGKITTKRIAISK